MFKLFMSLIFWPTCATSVYTGVFQPPSAAGEVPPLSHWSSASDGEFAAQPALPDVHPGCR